MRGPHLPSSPPVSASGDESGAANNALKYNRPAANDTPIMSEFDARLTDLAKEGRDFF